MCCAATGFASETTGGDFGLDLCSSFGADHGCNRHDAEQFACHRFSLKFTPSNSHSRWPVTQPWSGKMPLRQKTSRLTGVA